MLSFSRLRRRLSVASTVTLSGTLVVAVAMPQIAVAEGGPSVALPEVASVGSSVAGVQPHNPADAESEKNALRGEQGDRQHGSGGGNYSATSLSPSATWQVSGQTGDFSWSYPLAVTQVPGGVQPSLALSYSSSAVDGLTSATNNQASWVGDGWALWPGFVERTYDSCQRDVENADSEKPMDQCWRNDNATLSLNGSATMLIRDEKSGAWRGKSDDGSRIERLGKPEDRDESWKVTTTDGTQYFFGSRPEAKSAWKVPVFGDDSGEPCYNPAGFASSWCDRTYRWNVDKVISRTGDMMVYNYETETNKYGRNKATAVSTYDRGGYLTTIDYGLRADDAAVQASGRVVFDVADRCIPGTDCGNLNNWPDVPSNLKCDDNVCKDRWSPSFFSTKRLHKITTQIRKAGTFAPVDSWTLRHTYPEPGDGERPAMWLAGVTHTGHTGPAGAERIPLPEVVFEGARLPNRVYTPGDGHSKLIRYRMNAILSESGGVTGIRYAEPECVPGRAMPDPKVPEQNTMRCYPAKWAAPLSAPRTDYFHKYVVAQVTSLDRMGSTVADTTTYQYPANSAAWHKDESEFTPDAERTWNSFRGYGTVTVLKGNGSDGPRSKTVQTFYRGMNGDHGREFKVRDSENGEALDENWLNGQMRESITYLGETDTVVTKTISEPHFRKEPTAVRGPFKAHIVRPGTAQTYTPLKAGGVRQTKSVNKYDDADLTGSVIAIDDFGDVGTDKDDRCTRNEYDRRPDTWLMALPSRIQTVSVHCGVPVNLPVHALSETVSTYDSVGNPTEIKQLSGFADGEAVYISKARTTDYDRHGRGLAVLDAEGHQSKVSFNPSLGGPVTSTTVTNALNESTTTTYDELRGIAIHTKDANGRVSQSQYDALGRLIETWSPDRDRSRRQSGSAKFSYTISHDAPNAVETKQLGPNGKYITSTQILDGLLRPRQTQVPTQDGRLLTDTRYDSHGRAYLSTMPFFNKAPVDMRLWQATNLDGVPGHTVTKYDGAERAVEQIFMAPTEQWKTTTEYGGDRVTVTPPAGGTTTTTVTDARGQVVQKLTYSAPGVFDTTAYSYHPDGQVAQVTDPGDNTWKFEYDLSGRVVLKDDPVKGRTTLKYDKLGRLTETTDARGITLTNTYDALGRRKTMSRDTTKLAEWAYDTASNGKGMLASATRYVNGHAYVTRVTGYDIGARPYRTEIEIPAVEGKLAGTYVAKAQYGPDGTQINAALPQIDTMPAETLTYSHDDLGRPTTTTSSLNGQTDYVSQSLYTVYGEPERLQLGVLPQRVWLSYYFDEKTRRLTRSIVDTETSKPMQTDVNYTYDPAGNVLSIVDKPIGQKVDTQCFRYDHLRRLTEAWTPDTGCAEPVLGTTGPEPYWQSFRYDKVGNRLSDSLRGGAGPELTSTYHYTGSSPRLRSMDFGFAGAAAATKAYDYDPAGNTIKRDSQVLDWTDEGLLGKVTDKGAETSFVYTADGQRLIRHDPAGSTLYLGSQEVRVDKATGTKTVTRTYSHAGKPVAVRVGSKLTWLASDHQGTNQVAVDPAELKADKRRQLPFGGPRGQQPLFPGEKGFVGGTVDESIGLTTMGPRQYDSQTGRFLSVDPIMDPSDPQQMHGYTYSNNSPITFSDPSGMWLVGGDDSMDGGQWGIRNNSDGSQTVIGVPPPSRQNHGNGIVSRKTSDGGGYINRIRVNPKDTKDFAALLSMANRKTIGQPVMSSARDNGYDLGHSALILKLACDELEDTSAACSEEFADQLDQIIFDEDVMPTPGRGSIRNMGRLVKKLANWGRKEAKESAREPEYCSFTGETAVVMADGSAKPIAKVKIGDQVLATDPETGQRAAKTVTAVMVHGDMVQDLVTEDGATVTTTRDHRFWNETDREWQRADQLDPGDSLLTATGERVEVKGFRAGTQQVTAAYNLTVQDLHTYHVMVGAKPVLVHNECPEFKIGRRYEDEVTLSDGKVYLVSARVVYDYDDTIVLDGVDFVPADMSVNWEENRKKLPQGEIWGLVLNRYLPKAKEQGYANLEFSFTRTTGNPDHRGRYKIPTDR
ncbi:polymorphic toxin-type HINT domain-containing protein [Kibdelosporangium aridum]|uniref:polymorphic toxin-type HINT domain-containing protein n=1 Tax=Kibdelosporangium aridum TaxID=2030 RepID=UPI00068EF958|nr:polymorphic toxin-type HINT domain-containing protein [Kibdelosporangium aridum]